MKVTYNNYIYELSYIAKRYGETEKMKRMGEVNYLNYLRVYRDMDVWPCEEE